MFSLFSLFYVYIFKVSFYNTSCTKHFSIQFPKTFFFFFKIAFLVIMSFRDSTSQRLLYILPVLDFGFLRGCHSFLLSPLLGLFLQLSKQNTHFYYGNIIHVCYYNFFHVPTCFLSPVINKLQQINHGKQHANVFQKHQKQID